MLLTLYKRGAYWHYQGTHEGVRYRGTTGATRRDEASRKLAEIQAEILRDAEERKAGDKLTFARAAILYLKAGKPTRFVQEMKDHWGEKPVSEITPGKIRQAAVEIFPKATGATRNRHVIVPTQAIINHAASLDLCPPIRMKRFKVETKTKKPATWEWVQEFMKHSNPHLGALCCFMFLTGARVSEAVDLRWSEVNFLTSKAIIRQTKVGKERQAHLPPELVKALQAIDGEREPDGKVFKYSSRHTVKPQWNKVFRRCDIEYLTFHSCRHGFATTLLHRGVDPITVAKLGGWADAQLVFNTYGHAMRDETLTNVLVTNPDTDESHKVVKLSRNNNLKISE
ncbi:site-specific integrase [Sinorhizobium meliloti]|uniref:tyrosine-type recombinase/integrase n=1 Tax=Rhizobium meliloti TaxID=382 RepID=UPI000FD9C5C7|nr:site-specific integrase [Sinorhizobium meliloti]RVQ13926.1 site-specific integrase [Sinorhizobium meliloti]